MKWRRSLTKNMLPKFPHINRRIGAKTSLIKYEKNVELNVDDIIRVFDSSTINRPTDDPSRIKTMFDHARKIDITCFSTPFDETAVDLLEDLNVPAYKVASFEATDLPLIKYVTSTKKPLIISTGLANFEEIEEIVEIAKEGGCNDLILLHCVSSYPAPMDQSNLLTIPDMRRRLGVQIGLSDHTVTNTASVVASALGATLIEKHFILDRNEKGPDSEFSIEPDELIALCKETKDAWLSLGTAGYDIKPSEEASIKFRRSIYFVKDISAGDIITKEHIKRIRPGFGLSPKYFNKIIEMKTKKNLSAGDPLKLENILGFKH